MIQLDIYYFWLSFIMPLDFSCVMIKKRNLGGLGIDLTKINFHNACSLANRELETTVKLVLISHLQEAPKVKF